MVGRQPLGGHTVPGDMECQDHPSARSRPCKPEERGLKQPQPRHMALRALVREALPTPRPREGCLGAGECTC